MNRALAIFRKDVRHLWPRIALVLAVELFIGWTSFSPPAGFGRVRYPLGLVEVLACWYLIASAIHQEPLRGNRQYWVTRPFSRWNLLSAKLLFILAFTCLPLFLAQVASLLLRETSPLRYMPEMLACQLLFLATIVLPAAALASISSGLVEFAAIALVAWQGSYVLAFMVGSRFRADIDWGGLFWFRPTLAAALTLAAAVAILLLQYLQRRTWLCRGIVAAVLVASAFLTYMPGWHTAFQLLERPSAQLVPATVAHIAFDPTRDPHTPTLPPDRWTMLRRDATPIPIPVRVTGIPRGMALYSDRVAVTVGAPDGQRRSSGWDSLNELVRLVGTIYSPDGHQIFAETEARVLAWDGEYWLYVMVDRSFYRRARTGPMRLHAQLGLTLLSPLQITPLALRDGAQAVPDDGFCLLRWRDRFLESNCQWPGRAPTCSHLLLRVGSILRPPGQAYLVSMNPEDDGVGSYASYPTSAGLWQGVVLGVSAEEPPLGIDLVTRKAVAHFERELDIPDLGEWTNR